MSSKKTYSKSYDFSRDLQTFHYDPDTPLPPPFHYVDICHRTALLRNTINTRSGGRTPANNIRRARQAARGASSSVVQCQPNIYTYTYNAYARTCTGCRNIVTVHAAEGSRLFTGYTNNIPYGILPTWYLWVLVLRVYAVCSISWKVRKKSRTPRSRSHDVPSNNVV